MDAFISEDSELARTREHKNKNAVSFLRRLHAQLTELLLGLGHWIAGQFAPLEINANLSGCLRFGFSNRGDDALVIELAEEFLGSHIPYQLDPAPPPPKLPPPPLKPLNPPPEKLLPPPLDQPPMNGPPMPV